MVSNSCRRFLSTLIRRIALFDEDGTIELADQPVYGAIEVVSTSARHRKHSRQRNHLSGGSPSGVRTRVHLVPISTPNSGSTCERP